jgi:hypothetical protein
MRLSGGGFMAAAKRVSLQAVRSNPDRRAGVRLLAMTSSHVTNAPRNYKFGGTDSTD